MHRSRSASRCIHEYRYIVQLRARHSPAVFSQNCSEICQACDRITQRVGGHVTYQKYNYLRIKTKLYCVFCFKIVYFNFSFIFYIKLLFKKHEQLLSTHDIFPNYYLKYMNKILKIMNKFWKPWTNFRYSWTDFQYSWTDFWYYEPIFNIHEQLLNNFLNSEHFNNNKL
jgi:hypothetical protein